MTFQKTEAYCLPGMVHECLDAMIASTLIHMNKIKYFGIALLLGFILYSVFFQNRRTICRGGVTEKLTISTIHYGSFSEFIPLTGIFIRDTIANDTHVHIEIDELYRQKIHKGLKATTYFKDSMYTMEITRVNDSIIGGRFYVEASLQTEKPNDIINGQSLRLRLELTEAINTLLLPVGGFYKDTGGKWAYLVKNGSHAIRHHIKLGRKNTEVFEVLEGLKPGDQVITSSYENFKDNETLDMNKL